MKGSFWKTAFNILMESRFLALLLLMHPSIINNKTDEFYLFFKTFFFWRIGIGIEFFAEGFKGFFRVFYLIGLRFFSFL